MGLLLIYCQSQHGVVRGDQPPPPPSQGSPDISGILPENAVATPVPSRGVPGWGVKPDHPPGKIYSIRHCIIGVLFDNFYAVIMQ